MFCSVSGIRKPWNHVFSANAVSTEISQELFHDTLEAQLTN
jgi:hypothetical protein